MATLASLVTDVYGMLHGIAQVERPLEDTLSTSAINTTETAWTMATTSMWKRGDLMEPAGGTELIIHAQDHATSTVVRRGQRGTTAASYSSGQVFYKNPMFPRYMVENTVNEVIDNEFWPDVWYRTERTLTWDTSTTMYDLNASDYLVEQVYQYDLNSDGKFHPFPDGWWEEVGSVASGAASTGRMLRLFQVYDDDTTVYYTTRTQPSSSAISSLPATVANIVPYGVVGKLLLGTRVAPQRSAPSRSPQAVSQAGDRLLRDHSYFQAEFERMKKGERHRLQRLLMKQPRYRRRTVRRA